MSRVIRKPNKQTMINFLKNDFTYSQKTFTVKELKTKNTSELYRLLLDKSSLQTKKAVLKNIGFKYIDKQNNNYVNSVIKKNLIKNINNNKLASNISELAKSIKTIDENKIKLKKYAIENKFINEKYKFYKYDIDFSKFNPSLIMKYVENINKLEFSYSDIYYTDVNYKIDYTNNYLKCAGDGRIDRLRGKVEVIDDNNNILYQPITNDNYCNLYNHYESFHFFNFLRNNINSNLSTYVFKPIFDYLKYFYNTYLNNDNEFYVNFHIEIIFSDISPGFDYGKTGYEEYKIYEIFTNTGIESRLYVNFKYENNDYHIIYDNVKKSNDQSNLTFVINNEKKFIQGFLFQLYIIYRGLLDHYENDITLIKINNVRVDYVEIPEAGGSVLKFDKKYNPALINIEKIKNNNCFFDAIECGYLVEKLNKFIICDNDNEKYIKFIMHVCYIISRRKKLNIKFVDEDVSDLHIKIRKNLFSIPFISNKILKYCTYEKILNKSILDIRKNLNISIKSPIKTQDINKILINDVDINLKINLFKYDENKKILKLSNKFYSNKIYETSINKKKIYKKIDKKIYTKKNIVLNLFLHEHHYMIIKDLEKLKNILKKYKTNDFQLIVEKNEDNDIIKLDEYFNEDKKKEIKLKDIVTKFDSFEKKIKSFIDKRKIDSNILKDTIDIYYNIYNKINEFNKYNIYIYDLETLTYDNIHKVYAVGVCNLYSGEKSFINIPECIIYYGLDSLEIFKKNFINNLIKKCYDINNIIKKELNKHYLNTTGNKIKNDFVICMNKYIKNKLLIKCTFYAHNASRFDNFLMLEILKVDKCILSNGFLSIDSNSCLIFKDSFRHLSSSLDNLCKSFKINSEISKGDFPHSFLNEFKDLNYIGDIPDVKYWGNLEKYEYIYNNLKKENKLYDLKQESFKYLKNDVLSLKHVLLKYNESLQKIDDKIKINFFDFLTLPSMAYNLAIERCRNNKNNIKIINNLEIDKIARRSSYGGITTPQKKIFKSKNYDYIINKVKNNEFNDYDYNQLINNNDCLILADAKSLYPSAMVLYEYPIIEKNEDIFIYPPCEDPNNNELYKNLINELNNLTYDLISFIYVELVYNNIDNIISPVCADPNINKNGQRTYTLKNKIGYYSSIDIMEMIKYNNFYVKNIYSCVEFKKKGYIFDCIKKIYEMKEFYKTNGNENLILSEANKLIMNALYGHMGKKNNCEKYDIVNKKEEFDEYIIKNDFSSFSELNKDQILFKIKQDNNKVERPAYISSLILSYSKVIMNNALNIIGGFNNIENTFSYKDTDSMFIKINCFKILCEKGLVGGKMGQFGNDLGGYFDLEKNMYGSIIIYGIFIAPKIYYVEYIEPYFDKVEQKMKYKLIVKNRLKGVSTRRLKKENEKDLKKYYEDMKEDREIKIDKITRFKRNLYTNTTKYNCVGIETVTEDKSINKKIWNGRKYNPKDNFFYPYTNEDL